MSPRRRRLLAGVGLLVPAVALIFLSIYFVLGGSSSQTCTLTGGSAQHLSCTTDTVGASAVTFPVGIACLLVSAAVLRGARWSRWPAAVLGALLGTVTAAAGLAVLVALVNDGAAAGAALFAVGWIALTLVCALPAMMLANPEGAEALPGAGAPREVRS